MKHVKINMVYDKSLGDYGLKIHGVPDVDGEIMVSNNGLIIAHDLIEHPRVATIGGTADELQALGAAWYVRGQFDDFNRDHRSHFNPYEMLANDVVNVAKTWLEREDEQLPKRKIKVSTEYNEGLKEVLLQAKDLIGAYRHLEGNNLEARIGMFFVHALPLMQSGYNIVQAKYPNSVLANNVFWGIADVINEYLERGHTRIDGSYKLSYDPTGQADATFRHVEKRNKPKGSMTFAVTSNIDTM